ncbi:MAG: gamma-glutamyltransferase, partial [Candidatus Halalkalibacterium sp. M3_1C_030]
STVASNAGLQVLKNGGNAMDAALTTALTSIALQGGAAVSYAGFINVMYYDSETGKVHTMNGGFNTVKDETDPLTIDYEKPGRTVLVPGFMKGVESAHEKFGSIPFQTLFIPAIHFAEEGIPFPVHLNTILEQSKDHFSSENTQNLFKNDSGDWIKQGELFKQQKLAATLREVAEEGAQYMYSGDWAEKFVKLVRSQGGNITMEDLDNYDVIWDSPLTTEYNGYQVNAMPLPNTGGINTIEALNILSNLNFRSNQPYFESPESFFKLMRTSNVAHFMGTGINYMSTDSTLEHMPFPNLKFDNSSRITQTNAKAIANVILSKEWEEMMTKEIENKSTHGGHSDAVIAVDENGNAATILFTINTYGWGQNGIFVDGIPIPDAAVYQKHHLANIEPGERIPEATTPIIVLRN